MPEKFGKKGVTPTPEADIYAFGLVIFQVLTGEIPFRGVQHSALVYSVVLDEKRPDKPENASTIGLSDSLWDFTQRCWDGKMELRPEVGEVVTHLEEAVANWTGLMPPCPQTKNVAYDPTEDTSDSITYNGLFLLSPNAVPENPIEPQTTSESPTTPLASTQCTEPPQNSSQEVVTEPPEEPRAASPAQPRSEEPHSDDPHTAKGSSHTGVDPPSQLPQIKQKGSKHKASKLRRLLRLVY